MHRAIAAAIVLMLAAPHVEAVSSPSGGGGELVVVELAPTVAAPDREDVLRRRGMALLRAMPGSRFVLARTLPGAPVPRPDRDLASVRRPVTHRALGTPNDPLYPRQWHLHAVQASEAWDLATGAGVVVAVIDTGVARDAPDLAGIRFAAGYDWIDDDALADDENGHGTHVIATIAERTNNSLGAAGLAPDATIMPLRALDAEGAGIDFDIALAIHFAADHGATVINLSLGASAGSPVLQEAVAYAALKDVIVIAAAGNDGAGQLAFPAAYPDVLAIGAVGSDRSRAPYSNTGSGIDLVGPGGDLTHDRDLDGYGDGVLQQTIAPTAATRFCYCFFQGTSMAAPHVAATAALVASTGTSGRAAITQALLSTPRDLGPAGHDVEYGAGLVQAADAVRAATAASAPALPPLPPAPAVPTPETPGIAIVPQDIDPACPADRVRGGAFRDVPPESVHARAIDCAAWLGIAAGDAAGRFNPALGVARDQMASFLARAIERAGGRLPATPPDAFDDDDGNVHELRINQLASIGVIRGSAARVYAPRQPVSRAAMASLLARAYDAVAQRDLPAAGDHFDDDTGDIHEEQIDRVAASGVATGTGIRRYSPRPAVRRDQVATFLVRTFAALVEAGEASEP